MGLANWDPGDPASLGSDSLFVTQPVDNMFGAYDEPRDLLSKLAEHKDKDDYHFSRSSAWEDCNRISKLKKKGIVNPHSGHPTKEGHEIICDILSPSIERCL